MKKNLRKLITIAMLWVMTTACLPMVWGSRIVSDSGIIAEPPTPVIEMFTIDVEPEVDSQADLDLPSEVSTTIVTQSEGEISTPYPVCTPPACAPDEMYYCPDECPGGCGTTCATATPGAPSGMGQVWGAICFPSEMIPPMTLYFHEVNTAQTFSMPVDQNQTTYEFEIPDGLYVAFAWLPDKVFGGSYSQYLLCREGASCDDHSLIEFLVRKDHVVTGVDICDWYGDSSIFPEVP